MRTFFGILAVAILLVGAAHAKSGDYARNSKIYAEFIANCGAAKNDPPKLRDEAAKRLEKMSRKQFMLQIKGCQMSLPPEQRGAQNHQLAAKAHAQAPHVGEQQAYNTFDNVAAGSLKVRSHGKSYSLRRMHGPTNCPAPRHWYRTEKCMAIDHGGVRCVMECR